MYDPNGPSIKVEEWTAPELQIVLRSVMERIIFAQPHPPHQMNEAILGVMGLTIGLRFTRDFPELAMALYRAMDKDYQDSSSDGSPALTGMPPEVRAKGISAAESQILAELLQTMQTLRDEGKIPA